MIRQIFFTAVLPLAACSATQAVLPSSDAEAEIPFVRSNGISEWRAAGEGALYVKAVSGGWYLVRTMNRCSRLTSAVTVGFITSAGDELDRYGTLLAEGQRCPIRSVVRSAAPPEDAPKRS